MIEQPDVRWFADLRSKDIVTVGGDNAALGESVEREVPVPA